MGGRPRSTSASCGASSSCLSRLTAWWRESLTMTSKSFPRAYERVSVMRGSSSTIKRLGRGFSGMGFDAFQESTFQRRFPVALAQSAGRAGVGHRSSVENGDAVANLLDVGERMRAEKQGSPLGLEVQEQVLGAVACLGVQAAHRLVENVNIALREKAGSEPQFLGHALRIGADRLVEGGEPQIQGSEHLRDPPPPLQGLRKVPHPSP